MPGPTTAPLKPLETRPAPEAETVARPVTDDGDHDRFAHYVRKADAARAAVEGTPVRALCGKVWVPSRDPDKYPVCPSCADIRARMMADRRARGGRGRRWGRRGS